MIKDNDFIECGSPLGHLELHCDDNRKKQIMKNQKYEDVIPRIMNMVKTYRTPKHDRLTCDCHGCYLLRVVGSAFTETQLKEILK